VPPGVFWREVPLFQRYTGHQIPQNSHNKGLTRQNLHSKGLKGKKWASNPVFVGKIVQIKELSLLLRS
jgi:hypothetical protein